MTFVFSLTGADKVMGTHGCERSSLAMSCARFKPLSQFQVFLEAGTQISQLWVLPQVVWNAEGRACAGCGA